MITEAFSILFFKGSHTHVPEQSPRPEPVALLSPGHACPKSRLLCSPSCSAPTAIALPKAGCRKSSVSLIPHAGLASHREEADASPTFITSSARFSGTIDTTIWESRRRLGGTTALQTACLKTGTKAWKFGKCAAMHQELRLFNTIKSTAARPQTYLLWR